MMTGQSENVWQTDELLLSSLDGTTVPLMGDTRVRTGAPNSFTLDCSKVTSRNVVTYGWETRQYDGRLVDVHKDGEFLAYTLGGEKSLVRVISRLHQTKGLIRGFTGQVLDICWANISGPVTLACIDESGSLFVYRVVMGPTETEPFSLQRTLLLSYGAEAIRASRFRVRWCFYVPDSDSSTEDSGLDDLSQLLAITHGNEVQIVNVETVIDKHGDQCHYQGLTDGYITLEETSVSDFTHMASSK